MLPSSLDPTSGCIDECVALSLWPGALTSQLCLYSGRRLSCDVRNFNRLFKCSKILEKPNSLTKEKMT